MSKSKLDDSENASEFTLCHENTHKIDLEIRSIEQTKLDDPEYDEAPLSPRHIRKMSQSENEGNESNEEDEAPVSPRHIRRALTDSKLG